MNTGDIGDFNTGLFEGVVTVPLGRNGKYGSASVDCTKLNAIVRRHIVDYGLRQILNDAMAEKKDDGGNKLSYEEIVAKAQKRLDTLYSGELRTRRESSEPVDPNEREAWRMARDRIEKQLTVEKMWPTKGRDKFDRAIAARCEYLGREMTTEEYIVAWLEKNPTIRTQAAKIVRERNRADAGEMV